jgi:hypothetical protein
MQSDAAVFRTQESLDDGVQRVSAIYDKFKDIGIKDRSMIWNSQVSHFALSLSMLSYDLVILWRHWNYATYCNALSKQSFPLLLAKSPEVLMLVKIIQR